jgi:hypothetical protein
LLRWIQTKEQKNCKIFRRKGWKGKTYDDQKKETNAINTSQPKNFGIPYHTKTITTLGKGTMTCTNSVEIPNP